MLENKDNAIDTPQNTEPQIPPHKQYLARMASFGRKYAVITAISSAIALASVPLAIFYSLLFGAVLAIFSAVFYWRLVTDEARNTLGVKYKTDDRGMILTAVRAKYGDIVWVPSHIALFDISRIEDRAFCDEKNAELRAVFLPLSLKSIGDDIFKDCGALYDIYFEGSEEDWKLIEKNTDFSNYALHFNTPYPKKAKKKRITAKGSEKSV